jgi:hypothetical protein
MHVDVKYRTYKISYLPRTKKQKQHSYQQYFDIFHSPTVIFYSKMRTLLSYSLQKHN